MEEKHYIRFIDAYQNDKFIARMELTPLSVYPAACFHLKEAGGKITIVENCSIHGYWNPRYRRKEQMVRTIYSVTLSEHMFK